MYDIVSCQLEVWWEVVPLRFVVQPSVVPLIHSRRVAHVTATVHGVQLYGASSTTAMWVVPPKLMSGPPCELVLSPAQPALAQMRLALEPEPDHYPVEDLIE